MAIVTSMHDIPGRHVFQTSVRPFAGSATDVVNLFTVPFKAKVHSVKLRPDDDIAGADTDSANINLLDMGVDGDGADELANIDWEDNVDADLGSVVTLFAPATPLEVAAGTMLGLEFEKVGDGLALPSCLAIVEYEGA